MEKIFTKIEKVLTARGLKAKILLNKKALVDDRRFLVIPCQDGSGRDWLFKIQVLKLEGLGKSFRNEVQFLSFAQKTKIGAFIPKLLDSGELEGNVWYLREFISGQTLAASEDIFPYDPKILSKIKPILPASFFYELANLSVGDAIKFIPQIKRHDLDWKTYYSRFLKAHPEITKELEDGKADDYLTPLQQKKLLKLLMRPPEKVLTSYGWALNHANLSPMNIVVGIEGRPAFIDWENICVGFGTSGFAEFWYRSFLLPDWQNKFLEERLKLERRKEEFLKIFYFSLVFGNVGLRNYFRQIWLEGKLTKSGYRLAVSMWSKIIGEAIEWLYKELD